MVDRRPGVAGVVVDAVPVLVPPTVMVTLPVTLASGAASAPDVRAATYNVPFWAGTIARSSDSPGSKTTNGRSASPNRYSLAGVSVPAYMRPVVSIARLTTWRAAGR